MVLLLFSLSYSISAGYFIKFNYGEEGKLAKGPSLPFSLVITGF